VRMSEEGRMDGWMEGSLGAGKVVIVVVVVVCVCNNRWRGALFGAGGCLFM